MCADRAESEKQHRQATAASKTRRTKREKVQQLRRKRRKKQELIAVAFYLPVLVLERFEMSHGYNMRTYAPTVNE